MSPPLFQRLLFAFNVTISQRHYARHEYSAALASLRHALATVKLVEPDNSISIFFYMMYADLAWRNGEAQRAYNMVSSTVNRINIMLDVGSGIYSRDELLYILLRSKWLLFHLSKEGSSLAALKYKAISIYSSAINRNNVRSYILNMFPISNKAASAIDNFSIGEA